MAEETEIGAADGDQKGDERERPGDASNTGNRGRAHLESPADEGQQDAGNEYEHRDVLRRREHVECNAAYPRGMDGEKQQGEGKSGQSEAVREQ